MMHRLVRCVGCVIGAILVTGGVALASDPLDAVFHVRAIGLGASVPFVIAGVAGLEVYAGIGLLRPRPHARDIAVAIASVALLSAFLVVLGGSSGWSEKCGCGVFEMSVPWAIARNAAMLAGLVLLRRAELRTTA